MPQVPAFHTDRPEYPPSHRGVYHDQSECAYGKEIKRNNHAVHGTHGRPRCTECARLSDLESRRG